jgi:hypothetical protein
VNREWLQAVISPRWGEKSFRNMWSQGAAQSALYPGYFITSRQIGTLTRRAARDIDYNPPAIPTNRGIDLTCCSRIHFESGVKPPNSKAPKVRNAIAWTNVWIFFFAFSFVAIQHSLFKSINNQRRSLNYYCLSFLLKYSSRIPQVSADILAA